MLQSRRRRRRRRLEVLPPRWEAGAAGAGKGAWGAGARRGLLRPGRDAASGSERARSTQAPCSGWPSAGAPRGSSPQPAPAPPAAPRAARGRPSVAGPPQRGQAASPGERVEAEAAAGRLRGRPERALPPAATRSRRWPGRRAPQAAGARPRPRRERAPGRSPREAARAVSGTDGVAGRSRAAAQRRRRRRRRGRRQGDAPSQDAAVPAPDLWPPLNAALRAGRGRARGRRAGGRARRGPAGGPGRRCLHAARRPRGQRVPSQRRAPAHWRRGRAHLRRRSLQGHPLLPRLPARRDRSERGPAGE